MYCKSSYSSPSLIEPSLVGDKCYRTYIVWLSEWTWLFEHVVKRTEDVVMVKDTEQK